MLYVLFQGFHDNQNGGRIITLSIPSNGNLSLYICVIQSNIGSRWYRTRVDTLMPRWTVWLYREKKETGRDKNWLKKCAVFLNSGLFVTFQKISYLQPSPLISPSHFYCLAYLPVMICKQIEQNKIESNCPFTDLRKRFYMNSMHGAFCMLCVIVECVLNATDNLILPDKR